MVVVVGRDSRMIGVPVGLTGVMSMWSQVLTAVSKHLRSRAGEWRG